MSSPSTLGMVAVVLIVLVGAFWFGRGTPAAPVASADTVAPSPLLEVASPAGATGASPETMTIHVAGEVTRPGLVVVPAGARIADVIVAAGGATSVADLSLVNLAAGVADGAQVVVPRFGASAAPVHRAAAAEPDSTVHVNSADLDDLMRLPGIGPVTARQILDYRTANGPFQVVEDLLDVPGIGEGKLASLREGVAIP